MIFKNSPIEIRRRHSGSLRLLDSVGILLKFPVFRPSPGIYMWTFSDMPGDFVTLLRSPSPKVPADTLGDPSFKELLFSLQKVFIAHTGKRKPGQEGQRSPKLDCLSMSPGQRGT